MRNHRTDRDWELWGQRDPYYGVITAEQNRAGRLDEAAREEFFRSGSAHVEHVLRTCREKLDPGFAPTRVLDFGCGVGRLVVPFARVAGSVVGVDVSASMLAEARRNCQAQALDNVQLVGSDDDLSLVEGTFDLVHTFIVLQHIPPARGVRLFARLVSLLEPGGLGAIHFTYATRRGRSPLSFLPSPLASVLRKAAGVARSLPGRVRAAFGSGTAADPDPPMMMAPYPVATLLTCLQDAGVPGCHLEYTDHGGERGLFLFFKKPGPA